MNTQCPFLKVVTAHFCEIAPEKKFVPANAVNEDEQICSSPAYADCPLAKKRLGEVDIKANRCPFILSTTVNYCSAAASTKLIPANSDSSSRCNTSAHKYCDIFLQCTGHDCHHRSRRGEETSAIDTAPIHEVLDKLPLPDGLALTRNHMWMDVGESGDIHIGVDAFLARTFGEVKKLRLVPGNALRAPSVVLNINGVELPIVFPRHVPVTGINKSLVEHPDRLAEDPYGTGWLFEYLPSSPEAATFAPPAFGLMGHDKARAWIDDEVTRMSAFLGELSEGCGDAPPLQSDGGIFVKKIAHELSCPDLILMYNRFFSPLDRLKK